MNGATVTNNYVHDNLSVGLWADTNNRGFDFEGNYISGNYGEGLLYETSYNAKIVNNTFVRNAWCKGPTNPGGSRPVRSTSRSPVVTAGSRAVRAHVRDVGQRVHRQLGGVIMWENADRYCGSGANTSTGYCTLVNPGW